MAEWEIPREVLEEAFCVKIRRKNNRHLSLRLARTFHRIDCDHIPRMKELVVRLPEAKKHGLRPANTCFPAAWKERKNEL